MNREANITRKTKETDITVLLKIDGGEVKINTGIGFLDHMLTALGVHGGFGLTLEAKGDLYVDGHHTAEDVGIVLGKAFCEALGDKGGIVRYGSAFIPMDEALGFCAVDISGRPFLVFNAEFVNEKIGELDTCLIEEFMRAFAFNAGITLHLRCEYGKNDHHKAEALFKALAYALKTAVKPNSGEIVSTKGVL
ncbi:MAG TPA: imidazoleglycerol-phosphate dehydratase HisB [Ruminococcaceae bacterium]|nr:imidazoleglycerol-phosphate dehydratase HisB [Oscillospiraceae bacterium]